MDMSSDPASSKLAADEQEASRLLAGIANGSQQSMAMFYRRFAGGVYTFALRRLDDPSDAEETVSEVMWEVWKSAARYRGASKVCTWLFAITRNRVLDKIRRRKHGSFFDLDESSEPIADERATGFELVFRQQRAAYVAECIARLPADQRDCIDMVFYRDLGLADVARIQCCPENTVKTRLFHARRKLRAYLDHWDLGFNVAVTVS